jgi:hypothetical protein
MTRTIRYTLIALTLFAGGCALAVRHPSVAELQYNPGRYYDRTVAVEGVVTSSWGIPLVPFQMYKVDDGTGEVTVLAHDGRTPPRGARVRVRGKVEQLAVFGGRSLGLHIREDDVDFRGRRW